MQAGSYCVRPIKITIDVDPQKIPELVCYDYSMHADSGSQQIAVAVAEALGIEDYLSRPDRIYELRRWMWERGDRLAFSSQQSDMALLEMPAD